MSLDSTIRKAQRLARSGDLKGAARLLNQVLAKAPGNRVARQGLASVTKAMAAAGETSAQAPKGPSAPPASGPRRPGAPTGPQPAPRALRQLEALIARPDPRPAIAEGQRLALLYPRSSAALNLLGLAQTKAKRFDDAATTFSRLSDLDPSSVPARVNLANALLAAGRFDEAAEAAAEVLALDPSHAQVARLKGFALTKAGRRDAAEAAFREAIRLAPEAAQGHLGLGHLFNAAGRTADALAAYETALGLDPENVEAANNVGAMLTAVRRSADAVAVLAPAVDRAPKNRALRGNLARALNELGRAKEAIVEIDAAIEVGGETAALLALKASALATTGALDAAKEVLDRATALDPGHADLLVVRGQIAPDSFAAADRDRMAALMADDNLPDRTRAALAFAQFKALDRAGDIAAAADSLVRGNALQRQLHPYDIAAEARQASALAEMFPAPGPELSQSDIADMPARHRIVFIVGMPRSGTTLVEQILASHSAVHGAGELRLLADFMTAAGWTTAGTGAGPDRATLRALRRAYLDGIAKLGADAPVVTDKMPLNFRYLGHALAAFPEARALVLDRDARAVCWSNWRHDFRGRANGFGNDMGDLVRMYRIQQMLSATYASAYPDRVATVPYETLTENQEEESRRLVAAAGLDWEPACLAFHETDRAVRTASSAQVRRSIYTGSSEDWRRYEAHLGPLLAALEAV